jgi:hypothetical protein
VKRNAGFDHNPGFFAGAAAASAGEAVCDCEAFGSISSSITFVSMGSPKCFGYRLFRFDYFV